MILASFPHKPDIFIAGDKNLICILDSQGKGWVNSLQAGRFARENWLKMVALQEAQKFSKDNKEKPSGILETSKAYIVSKNGKTVAIFKNQPEKDFDLSQNDVNILPYTTHASNSPNIITGYDLKMKGGYFIWMAKEGVKIRTVHETVGNRPWSLKIEHKNNVS